MVRLSASSRLRRHTSGWARYMTEHVQRVEGRVHDSGPFVFAQADDHANVDKADEHRIVEFLAAHAYRCASGSFDAVQYVVVAIDAMERVATSRELDVGADCVSTAVSMRSSFGWLDRVADTPKGVVQGRADRHSQHPCSCARKSRSDLLRFRLLQPAHALVRFSHVFGPPATIGTM